MLRPPVRSVTAETGWMPCTRAPATYNGSWGPGMLDTKRLNGGPGLDTSRKRARDARPDSAVGMAADTSARIVAGTASYSAFASDIASATARNRSSESARWVGNWASITEMWLPRTLWSPSSPVDTVERIETGTAATNGIGGNESWSISQRRSAPVAMAMTTSLTVSPKAFLTCLTSSSGTEPYANRRCAVIPPLNGVRGTLRSRRPRSAGDDAEPRVTSETTESVRSLTVRTPGRFLAPGRSARCGNDRGSDVSDRPDWTTDEAKPRTASV